MPRPRLRTGNHVNSRANPLVLALALMSTLVPRPRSNTYVNPRASPSLVLALVIVLILSSS